MAGSIYPDKAAGIPPREFPTGRPIDMDLSRRGGAVCLAPLALGALGLAEFLGALKSGQFDDPDGAARATSDGDPPEDRAAR